MQQSQLVLMNFHLQINVIKLLMINSERFRPSMQITVADIFQDFNDPKRQILSKRVVIALQDLERRLKNQLDSTNLTNLQMLLKKQQVLKNQQQKMAQKDEIIQQMKQKLKLATTKVEELQKDLLKRTEGLTNSQEKLKTMTGSLKSLQSMMKTRQKVQYNLEQQKESLTKQIQNLQNDKQKYERLIANLRQTYSKKVQESQYILKIKQKQIAEEFSENLSQIVTKNAQQKQRKEIDQVLKKPRTLKVQTKTQRIQCDLITALARESPRKKLEVRKQEREIQTDETESTRISEVIQKNEKQKQQQQNLQQIRLVYSKSIVVFESTINEKPPTPKIITYTNVFTEQRWSQTDPEVKIRRNQQIQVNLRMQGELLQTIDKLKQQLSSNKQFYQHKYSQLKQLYNQKAAEISKIQHYKLQILELKLQLQKREYQFTKQRQTLIKINQKLYVQQNQSILKKFSGKLQFPQSPQHQKSIFSKTCSYSTPQKTNFVNYRNSDLHVPQQSLYKFNQRDSSQQYQSKMLQNNKWVDEQTDLITVIRNSNNLKFHTQKRRSVTEEANRAAFNSTNISINRGYRKYSHLKRR